MNGWIEKEMYRSCDGELQTGCNAVLCGGSTWKTLYTDIDGLFYSSTSPKATTIVALLTSFHHHANINTHFITEIKQNFQIRLGFILTLIRMQQCKTFHSIYYFITSKTLNVEQNWRLKSKYGPSGIF